MAKKKTTAVRKAAKAPTVKQLKAEVSSLTREEASYKHAEATARTAASRKHDAAEVASIGKKITSVKHTIASKSSRKTGLALAPGDVACCAAQALAASLRLALGAAVHDEDVLALYWRTAGDPDEGASVLATLEAGREYGLAGWQTGTFSRLPWQPRNGVGEQGKVFGPPPTPVILDLTLPEGPHAVVAALDGTWWSWGEPYSVADFPGAVLEDAWAVTW